VTISYQSGTFTVTLKAGDTGLSKPVKIWYPNPSGGKVEVGTVNTVDGEGKLPYPLDDGFSNVIYADFGGDSEYAASSGTATVIIGSS
jgi:hypothetical protein